MMHGTIKGGPSDHPIALPWAGALLALLVAVPGAYAQPTPPAEAPPQTPPLDEAARAETAPEVPVPAASPVAPPPAQPVATPNTQPEPQELPSESSEPPTEDGPLIELPGVEEEIGLEGGLEGQEEDLWGARTDKFSSIGSKTSAIVNRTVIGGYAEAPFVVPFDGDSFFEARRLIIFLHSQLHERISFTTEIEFEFGGTPKKLDGQLGFGEAILEYAAVDFRIVDLLTLRTGIVLVPFGKFNINHDSPTRDLTDRPLVIRTIIPSTWFEAGAGGFGEHSFGGVKLNWEGYAINGLDSRIFDGLGNRGARGSLIQDNNNDKALVGRLGLEYFLPSAKLQMEFGSSYYDGEYNRAGAHARIVGGDLTMRLGKFELLGEVVRQFNEPGFDDDFDSSSRRMIPEDLWGFYAQVNYHFFPEFLRDALPNDLQDSTFTASLRYDMADTDMSLTNENDRNIIVGGINYRPIEGFVWKHEIQRRDSKVTRRNYHYVTSVAYLY